MAAHTGAHTRRKRRGQKKEAQRIPYRLEVKTLTPFVLPCAALGGGGRPGSFAQLARPVQKLDVLDLEKKMELFEDGKVRADALLRKIWRVRLSVRRGVA
jgi:hypothetical protein